MAGAAKPGAAKPGPARRGEYGIQTYILVDRRGAVIGLMHANRVEGMMGPWRSSTAGYLIQA